MGSLSCVQSKNSTKILYIYNRQPCPIYKHNVPFFRRTLYLSNEKKPNLSMAFLSFHAVKKTKDSVEYIYSLSTFALFVCTSTYMSD